MSDTPLKRVSELLDQSLRIHLLIPDETGYFAIDGEPLTLVKEILDAADAVLPEIARDYGRPPTADTEEGRTSEADLLSDIGAQISSELASQEIAGLAFVAQRQLREASAELSGALASGKIWRVASRTDSALRRLRKALIAIESAILEFEEREPRLREWIDLASSITTRSEYSRFRRAVTRGGSPRTQELRERLRKALTRISILRKLAIYPYLRIDDRRSIRKFEQRIGVWLDDTEHRDDAAGFELWADLVAFAGLLGEVSKREELREHDRRMLDECARKLSRSASPDTLVSTDDLAELDSLLGSDDELDEHLLDPAPTTTAELLPIVERIRRAF